MCDTTPGLCSHLCNCFQTSQTNFWHLIWIRNTSPEKIRRAFQDSMVGVLAYLIKEVICFAKDLITAVGRSPYRALQPKGWALSAQPLQSPTRHPGPLASFNWHSCVLSYNFSVALFESSCPPWWSFQKNRLNSVSQWQLCPQTLVIKYNSEINRDLVLPTSQN